MRLIRHALVAFTLLLLCLQLACAQALPGQSVESDRVVESENREPEGDYVPEASMSSNENEEEQARDKCKTEGEDAEFEDSGEDSVVDPGEEYADEDADESDRDVDEEGSDESDPEEEVSDPESEEGELADDDDEVTESYYDEGDSFDGDFGDDFDDAPDFTDRYYADFDPASDRLGDSDDEDDHYGEDYESDRFYDDEESDGYDDDRHHDSKRRRYRHRHSQVRRRQAVSMSQQTGGPAVLEFDDSSVDPKAIPSGYFKKTTKKQKQRRQQQRRQQRANKGSINFPGFHLAFGSGWWEHSKNVCVRKKLLKRQPRRSRRPRPRQFTTCAVRCQELNATQFACNVTKADNNGYRVFQLVYSCCRGFTRRPGDIGCPRQNHPNRTQSFRTLLRRSGYGEAEAGLFAKALAEGRHVSRQWTVFLPTSEAMKNFTEPVLKTPRSVRKSKMPQQFVRTLMNHLAPTARHSSSFRADARLATRASPVGGVFVTRGGLGVVGGRRQRQLLANCVPIVRRDLPFAGRSIAHVTAAVLPAPNATLFRSAVVAAAATWRLDERNVSRVLAPLRSLLTQQIVTVFLHKPTKQELRTGCYARNVKSSILAGISCEQSLRRRQTRRSIDGRPVGVRTANGTAVLGRNAAILVANIVATNGVLHLVNDSVATRFTPNAAYQRLRSNRNFTLAFAPSARGVWLFLPPNVSYAVGADWLKNDSAVTSFGRRYLAKGGVDRSGRLTMWDGSRRVVTNVLLRPASIFSSARRLQFVDCVPAGRPVRNCDGSIVYRLAEALHDSNSSMPMMQFLNGSGDSSRGGVNYTGSLRILRYIETHSRVFNGRISASSLSVVLLPNGDLRKLAGRQLLAAERPSDRVMRRAAAWYLRHFMRSKSQCPLLRLRRVLRVPKLFSASRCRSIYCSLGMPTGRPRRVRLATAPVAVREGFVFPARVL